MVRSDEMCVRARAEIFAARQFMNDMAELDDGGEFSSHAQGVIDAAAWVLGERSVAPFSGREILRPDRGDLISEIQKIEDAIETRSASEYDIKVQRELQYLRFGGTSVADSP